MAMHAAVKLTVVDSEHFEVPPPLRPVKTAPVAAERMTSGNIWAWTVLRIKEPAGRWLLRLLALFAGLLFWHYASSTNLNFYVRFDNVPGPLRVGQALIEHLQHITFYLHIGVSLRRIAISYAAAAGLGVFLGILM